MTRKCSYRRGRNTFPEIYNRFLWVSLSCYTTIVEYESLKFMRGFRCPFETTGHSTLDWSRKGQDDGVSVWKYEKNLKKEDLECHQMFLLLVYHSQFRRFTRNKNDQMSCVNRNYTIDFSNTSCQTYPNWLPSLRLNSSIASSNSFLLFPSLVVAPRPLP